MAETIKMPKLGFDMAEGTLVRWVKKTGENVVKGDVLAEIETDKATVEVESSASGVVRKLLVDEGAVVPVNTPIAIVGLADEMILDLTVDGGPKTTVPAPAMPVVESKMATQINLPTIPASAVIAKASPLARKVARERRVDLSQVHGTGPGGRIVRRDIETILQTMERGLKTAGASSTIHHPPLATDETIGLTKLRQAIARRMTESKSTVPHFYLTHEYKMESLLEVRRQLNNALPENEKVSVNDFLIKAVAMTLRQFPNLNATFQGDKLFRHGQVNVGIAVAVEGGLLTVVCKDADAKPVRQIATEVKTMAVRARDGKVKPDDIEGSTFSLSNLGMFDVDEFIAIINPPEAAILAIGSAREVPVVDGGMVKPGWRMKATISVDHRVSDGAEAARFLQALAVYLEEPVRLLL